MECASDGETALRLVQKALSDNDPFAVVFCDMRMPGWDGLKTVQTIRKSDPRIEVVFITAYSDHSIEDIVRRAGLNISYFCKPFAVEEIRQSASKALLEWNRVRGLERIIAVVSNLCVDRDKNGALFTNILQQVCEMIAASRGALIQCSKKGQWHRIAEIGGGVQDEELRSAFERLGTAEEWMSHDENIAIFSVHKYNLLAFFSPESNRHLNTERIYLIRLFLQQAGLALTNIELQEELNRNEKLSVVGKALAMLAHDLRSPLCSVVSLSDQMEDLEPNSPIIAECIKDIKRSANMGLDYVQGILDFVREAPLERIELNTKELGIHLQELLQIFIPDSPRLELRISCPVTFEADLVQIGRLLLNLLSNSAQALTKTQSGTPRLVLAAESDGNDVVFMVEDNGPGLPPSVRSNLFVPFTTSGKSNGTGLGLSIARQIAERHGGSLNWDSGFTGGTRFTLRLPRSAGGDS